MLATQNVYHLEKTTNLRGRLRYDLGIPGFRCWLHLYAIDAYKCPSILPIAIQRTRKVRSIIQAHYPINSSSIELQKWAQDACSILDEILPTLERFPTHFLLVGIEVDGKDQPFFKTYLNLENGLRSSVVCASQIGGFIFQYFEGHITLSTESLDNPQTWIIDCLLAQWRLLRKIKV